MNKLKWFGFQLLKGSILFVLTLLLLKLIVIMPRSLSMLALILVLMFGFEKIIIDFWPKWDTLGETNIEKDD